MAKNNIDIIELYRSNEEFNQYVQQFSRKHNIDPTEALFHKVVQEVAKNIAANMN